MKNLDIFLKNPIKPPWISDFNIFGDFHIFDSIIHHVTCSSFLPTPLKNTGSSSAASSLLSHLSVRGSTVLPNHPSHECLKGTSSPFRLKCRPIMLLQLTPTLVKLAGMAQV